MQLNSLFDMTAYRPVVVSSFDATNSDRQFLSFGWKAESEQQKCEGRECGFQCSSSSGVSRDQKLVAGLVAKHPSVNCWVLPIPSREVLY